MPPNESCAHPAVFLDRDGTIMRDANYCREPAQVEIFPGVGDALRRLREAGFKIVIVTNQSGLGRGYFSEADYGAVAAEVERQLGPGLIDATYFCPDLPDTSSLRRKPAPGMILEAERDLGLDLTRSFMVGDKPIDVECGRNAGVRTIRLQAGDGEPDGADWSARDVGEASEIILRHAR